MKKKYDVSAGDNTEMNKTYFFLILFGICYFIFS